jgi:hypothetical protein
MAQMALAAGAAAYTLNFYRLRYRERFHKLHLIVLTWPISEEEFYGACWAKYEQLINNFSLIKQLIRAENAAHIIAEITRGA